MTTHAVAGYAHPAYAAALAEHGPPVSLPASGGWLLARPIPGDARRDLVGCYPLFACPAWTSLEGDLAALAASHVSVTLVADPFGAHDERLLARCFPDLRVPYKEHFVTDLRRPDAAIVVSHHRRNARRALQAVDVEACAHPPAHLDAWVALYAELTRRHGIAGPAAFSRASFAAQLAVPGLVALRAVRGDETVGMTLWYEQGDVAYYHLGAYSDAGYEHRAAFALFSAALAHFRGRVGWLALGAGAGVTSDGRDGLSRFKRGWATGTRTAWLCGRVLDPAAYGALVAARADDAAPGLRAAYFPAYRAAPRPTSGGGGTPEEP